MVTPERIRKRQHRIAWAQLFAYLLILVLSIALWETNEQHNREICHASEVNRSAVRGLVISIEQLGSQLVTNDEGEVTNEQIRALAAFRAFREQQLEELKDPPCE